MEDKMYLRDVLLMSIGKTLKDYWEEGISVKETTGLLHELMSFLDKYSIQHQMEFKYSNGEGVVIHPSEQFEICLDHHRNHQRRTYHLWKVDLDKDPKDLINTIPFEFEDEEMTREEYEEKFGEKLY